MLKLKLKLIFSYFSVGVDHVNVQKKLLVFGVKILTLLPPTWKHLAQLHSKRGGTIQTNPPGEVDLEPTGGCWGGGGAFEILNKQQSGC